jgi:hypothetical protein
LSDSLLFQVVPTYWPRRTGMFWWENFSAAEVRQEFDLAATLGFSQLGLKLIWTNFQSAASGLAASAMRALERTLQEAADSGLSVQITLLPFKIGALLWLPSWALVAGVDSNAAVLSGHHLSRWQARNLFADPGLREAQVRLVNEVTSEFGQHPAISSWVLADRVTTAVEPSSASELGDWLAVLADGLASSARERPVFYGLSASDLIRSTALSTAGISELGLGLQVATDWQPEWAYADLGIWVGFLAAYAGRLTGFPAGIALEVAAGSAKWDTTGARAEQIGSALRESGASFCALPTLFSLSPAAVRALPPQDRLAFRSGLIGQEDVATSDAQGWIDLAKERLPIAPIPEALSDVDPELRLRNPEQVARECYVSFTL